MRFTSANRTTRFGDLNHLEELRNLNRGKFTQQLDRIYRQSQDDELERLRRLLVEAHKRHDLKRVDEIERYLYQYQLKHR